METTDVCRPAYGTYTATDEELAGIPAVWGARLIAPADLVHDRQDLVSSDDEAREALIHWLNNGGIRGALDFLRGAYLSGSSSERTTCFEDERGIIVGSPQGSYGYIYVTGWLKP
jgi:hypothetical protein